MSGQKRTLFSSILSTGLIAGTLDMTAACIQAYLKRGTTPVTVCKYIASALFPSAFEGGAGMAIIGLVMHYMIAMSWTVIFFLLFSRLAFLRANKFAVGVLYGLFVWTMMNRVLVPMTLIKPAPFNLSNAVVGAIIIMVCIGIPISLGANKHHALAQAEKV